MIRRARRIQPTRIVQTARLESGEPARPIRCACPAPSGAIRRRGRTARRCVRDARSGSRGTAPPRGWTGSPADGATPSSPGTPAGPSAIRRRLQADATEIRKRARETLVGKARRRCGAARTGRRTLRELKTETGGDLRKRQPRRGQARDAGGRLGPQPLNRLSFKLSHADLHANRHDIKNRRCQLWASDSGGIGRSVRFQGQRGKPPAVLIQDRIRR